jgi:hypothetical protein
MAKKKESYTSKGQRRSSIGVKERDPMKRALNQINAWRKGKNVVLTVETNDPTQRFKRVNARDVWGSPFRKVKDKDES